MAKQRGELRLEGKMEDTVYYHTRRYGYITRKVGKVSKKKRQGPTFVKVRKNNTEFGYGSKVGKLLRLGVKSCIAQAEVGDTNNRLAGEIKKVLDSDTNNAHGQRRITHENASLLKGFSWKGDLKLHNVFWQTFSLTLDEEQSAVRLSIPAFAPSKFVKLGKGASHFEISLVVVKADYEKDSQASVCQRSYMINLAEDEVSSIELSCAIDNWGDQILVAGICVQGYQEMNGEMWALADRSVFEIVGGWAD